MKLKEFGQKAMKSRKEKRGSHEIQQRKRESYEFHDMKFTTKKREIHEIQQRKREFHEIHEKEA